MDAKELIIVIPAYEPDMELVGLVDKLNTYFTGHQLVVVDDGSKDKNIFTLVEQKDNVHLIHHDINMGKGAALKTGFSYIKSLGNDYVIVTADSDGQHKPEDIYRVYNFYKKYNYGLVLGSRKFDCDIPARSSFGNNCARFLLRSTQGIRLNDTQTGLRAFGTELLDFLLSIKGNRYEYEMDMLTLARQHRIAINEIAIETIYIDNNKASHFRPVRDFSRICSVILKYALPLVISLGVYLLTFLLIRKLSLALDNFNISYLPASLISGGMGFLVSLLIHASGYLYGNPYLLKNRKKFLFYFSGSIVFVLALTAIGLEFSIILKSYIGGALIGILLTIIILWLELFLFARRSPLYEG